MKGLKLAASAATVLVLIELLGCELPREATDIEATVQAGVAGTLTALATSATKSSAGSATEQVEATQTPTVITTGIAPGEPATATPTTASTPEREKASGRLHRPSPTSAQLSEPMEEKPATYIVQPGDTLGAISARFNIPLEALIAYNDIKEPDKLQVGQELRLPPPVYTPPVPTPTPRRLENGTYLKGPGPESCLGDLEVYNGTENDAVVVLTTLEEETVLSFYIQAESQFTATGICDGSYMLFFVLGEDWNEMTGKFNRAVRYEVFEGTLDYRTTATMATIWHATLHEVVGGTARTEMVKPEEFPPLR